MKVKKEQSVILRDADRNIIDVWKVSMDMNVDEVTKVVLEMFRNVDEFMGKSIRDFYIEKHEITTYV